MNKDNEPKIKVYLFVIIIIIITSFSSAIMYKRGLQEGESNIGCTRTDLYSDKMKELQQCYNNLQSCRLSMKCYDEYDKNYCEAIWLGEDFLNVSKPKRTNSDLRLDDNYICKKIDEFECAQNDEIKSCCYFEWVIESELRNK